MRVFPIVQTLARVSVGQQELRVSEDPSHERHVFPGGTNFIVNNTAIHYDPAHWPSPDTIAPERWLVSNPHEFDPAKAMTSLQRAEIEQGTVPIPGNKAGTFQSFGEGPRACLGRSFARVEFVAVIAPLLRRHRLEMVGEGGAAAAAKAMRTARLRSGGSPITLIPPEDLNIRLVERK
jgi:cytochrome P450